jgi:heptosyltransferase-2
MSVGGGALARLARLGVTQPLATPVASDDAFYLASKGVWKVGLRTMRRMAELRASGQRPLLRDAIDRRWGRALWIHEEAPQIGDALMDLAPRSLLAEHGIVVDLYAAASIAQLFAGDRWLSRTLADPAALAADRYDFVIAASHSAASLAVKRRRLPRLPWVSLKGYYGAYDYQRASFGALRLAQLLGVELDAAALQRHARQKLGVAVASPLPAAAPGGLRIAIAVGGVRNERRYEHWPEVVRMLFARGLAHEIVLIGSANGRAAVEACRAALPAEATLHDLVDRLDLQATRAAIEASQLLLCADGGLMHLGLTTRTPIVALFTSNIDPAWRLPSDFEGSSLRSGSLAVSAIDADTVAAHALRLASRATG